jgi:hypothetical protein
MRTFIALFAVLTAGVAMAQAYRWVDEDGVVHFSDVPVEGAELIQLPSDNRVPRPAPVAAARTTPQAQQATEPPEVFQYESIEVVAPAPEETLWNIEGVLNVAVRVVPALRQGDQVRVYFDGQERLTSSSTSFTIDEVYRGVHNIQVEVIDTTGQMLVRSLPNRFYVQQNSIAQATAGPRPPRPVPR